MPLYTAPNLTEGMDEALIGTVAAVPEFTPFFLLFVFSIVLIGGIVRQKTRSGSPDVPMWFSIASLTTLAIAMPLTFTSGLLQLETLAIVIAITIISGFWLFLDRNRNEV